MKPIIRLAALILAVPFIGKTALSGQTIPSTPPTPAECAAAVQALDSGNHNASAWYRLGACGVGGGNALARALRAGGAETDSLYLLALYSASSSIKDSAVFKAGLAMAGATSASSAIRVTAFLVSLSQAMPSSGLRLTASFASLWTTGVGSGCPLTSYRTRTFASTTFLSGEAAQQLAGKADEVRKSSAPAVVKDFAGCIRRTLESQVPTSISPSLITATYICGNRFRVQNGGTDWLKLTWTMSKWPETGAFQVGPNASFYLTTRSMGTVRFYQNGVLLFSAANNGLACNP